MKRSISMILFAFAFVNATAQVNLNMTMNPRPIANINDWSGRKDVLTLVATPQAQGGTRNVRINTVIKTADGTTVATTDMLRAQPKQLTPGSSTIFTVSDVVDLQAMVFTGPYLTKLNQTGKLPAGSYQLIVKLDSANSNMAVSNTQTRSFFLAATLLPVLIAPADNAWMDATVAQAAITFRWTPVSPKPQESVRYRLQVFEIGPQQTPMQALRSNLPLLNKEVVNTTQYIWRPQLGTLDTAGQRFVWVIQTVDLQGQPITSDVLTGDGLSEAKVFGIRPKL